MNPSSQSASRSPLTLAFALAISSAFMPLASAQQFRLTVGGGFPNSLVDVFQAGSITVEPDQASVYWPHGSAYAYAHGSVQPGILTATTVATATALQPTVTGGYVQFDDSHAAARANVYGDYSDFVTILGPGVPTGTPGTAMVHIGMAGLIGVTTDFGGPPGRTWARANARVNFWGTASDARWNYFDGFGNNDSPLDTGIPGSADLLFHFQYGVPFNVRLGMQVGGSVDAWADHWGYDEIAADTVAAFNFSFGEGIYWGGLSDVTANGVPLEAGSYSARSSGNIDFTGSFAPAEIPEPASWMAGLALLGAASAIRLRRGKSA